MEYYSLLSLSLFNIIISMIKRQESWKDVAEPKMSITKWEKLIWKCYSYILCSIDSNSMTFWKRQNYGDSKKISCCQWRCIGSAQRIFRTVKLFCMLLGWWIHLSKPIACTTPRVNPNVNYALWVIMMYQCRFTDCKKCNTLVGGCCYWRKLCMRLGRGIWELLWT